MLACEIIFGAKGSLAAVCGGNLAVDLSFERKVAIRIMKLLAELNQLHIVADLSRFVRFVYKPVLAIRAPIFSPSRSAGT